MGRKASNPEHLRVIDFIFNDIVEPNAWKPEEPWDIAEWVTLTVGDSTGGSNFQLHVCTPTSIKRQDDKHNVFLIEEYVGVDDLISRLDAFIAKIAADPNRNLIHVLATHWVWEYGPVERGTV